MNHQNNHEIIWSYNSVDSYVETSDSDGEGGSWIPPLRGEDPTIRLLKKI